MADPSLTDAAKHHLLLLRDDHERLERDDAHYVRLAARYGVGVDDISTLSGLPEARVMELLEVVPARTEPV